MKIEIDIPIEELDYESDYDYSDKGNHVDVLIEMITDKAASLLVQHIDYDYKISLEKSLENKINNIEKMKANRNPTGFRRWVVHNDSNISTGMKALISDIVRSEVKKIIKLWFKNKAYLNERINQEIDNAINFLRGIKYE